MSVRARNLQKEAAPDPSYSKEIEEILREKYPHVIVKYWGHDPDDIEMGLEEDGLSGFYDAFMAKPDIRTWYESEYYWFEQKCFDKKFPLIPHIIFHNEENTKKYYPKIYEEHLKRCQTS